MLRVGRVRACGVTALSELITERAPCLNHVGLERDSASQGGHTGLRLARVSERESLLVLSNRPIRLAAGQLLQSGQGRQCTAAAALCDPEKQGRARMAWGDLENLRSLFGCEIRISLEQPRRVGQRHFDGANRLRPFTHPFSDPPRVGRRAPHHLML